MNRGKYRFPVIIKEKKKLDTTNALGERDVGYVDVKTVFANIESRVGGLLSGRPADTVMTKVTHKITYLYKSYPNIMPDKNIIIFGDKKFEVNYSLHEPLDEEMQVFVTEKVTHIAN